MPSTSVHPYGRASALSGNTDHELVERLREICNSSASALKAATQYDLNFELKLADCHDDEQADAMLADWLNRRVDILHRTARDLGRTRKAALAKRSAGS